MNFTDLELASLLDALSYICEDLGANQTELNLLNKLSIELQNRGYSWASPETSDASTKVLKGIN